MFIEAQLSVGGSIVYGGISVQPPEDLFYKIFPAGISYQELQPYYDRVRHMLNITTVLAMTFTAVLLTSTPVSLPSMQPTPDLKS